MSYLGVGVSPGKVHGSDLKANDKRVRIAELVLRCLICVLGVTAAVIVGTDSQVKQVLSIRKKARFTDMKALVLMVVANGIAAAYSMGQAVRCVVAISSGSVLFGKPFAWLIFFGDQMMAYLTVSAAAAAAQSAALAKLGEHHLQWMKICNLYSKFCNQIGAGIATALLLSIAMILVSCISGFSLFRLYGPNKAKNGSTW